MSYNFPIRVWLVIMAIILAFITYVFIVQPILKKNCILNTQSCLQIQYQSYNNSVLTHILPFGIWTWFDGKDVIVYGIPTGQTCDDKDFEPAYVINTQQNKIEGWICVRKIETVQQFYNDKKCDIQYIFKCNPKKDFNIYDLINLLSDERIINISGGNECTKDSDCSLGNICQNGFCTIGFKPKKCNNSNDCEGQDICVNNVCVAESDCQRYAPSITPPDTCSLLSNFLVYSNSSLVNKPLVSKKNISNWSECQDICSKDSTCQVWEYDKSTNTCYTGNTTNYNLKSNSDSNVGIFKSSPSSNQGGTICQTNGDCTWPTVCDSGICKIPKDKPTLICDDVFKDCSRGMTCKEVNGVKTCTI